MKKIILSTLACATLVLAANTSKYELSPMFGQADTNHKSNDVLNNEKSFGLTLGLNNSEDSIFSQTELALFRSNSVDYKNSTKDTDVTRFLVSGVKNYPLSEDFSLYALAGIGYEKLSTKIDNFDSEFVANAGVGAKYSISESFALKAEARTVIRAKNENTALYHLGLVFPFGNEAAKKVEEVKAAPAKVTPAKVVEEVTIDMDKKVISHFDTDMANIHSDDAAKLKAFVAYMKEFPKSKIVVEGHTDSTASENHNKSLGGRRAMEVKKFIVNEGIDASRIRTESYGETMPVVDNKTAANRALNRRAEVKFIR